MRAAPVTLQPFRGLKGPVTLIFSHAVCHVLLCISGKSELKWEAFVDGAISLGAAITLADTLATAEGEAELRQLFETIEPDSHGRVLLAEWRIALREEPEVLAWSTGLEARSPRFRAFLMVGRFDTWINKIFRRLGLNEDGVVNWEEFRAGALQATDS